MAEEALIPELAECGEGKDDIVYVPMKESLLGRLSEEVERSGASWDVVVSDYIEQGIRQSQGRTITREALENRVMPTLHKVMVAVLVLKVNSMIDVCDGRNNPNLLARKFYDESTQLAESAMELLGFGGV